MDLMEATAVRPPAAPDRRSLAGVVVTGVTTFAAVQWLTPPPAHPEQYLLLGLLFETVFWGACFVGAYSLLQRRSFLGFGAISVAAWTMFAAIVACPVTGHHAYGMWWAGQLALGLAFGVCSTVAAAVSRRSQEPVRSPE